MTLQIYCIDNWSLTETELAVEVVSNYEMTEKKATRRKSCSCKKKIWRLEFRIKINATACRHL